MKKFIYTIIAMLGILLPTSAWAAEDSYREAYAVLEVTADNDGSITDAWLTLYYDDLKSTRKGTVVDLDKMQEEPNIMQAKRSLHSVIIDQSFADCRPTSTAAWFGYCMELKTISGLEYLNTSEVTDMTGMFMECGVDKLDLSTFNTSKVTTMNNMFAMCRGLVGLNISSFDTSNVTDMSFMFGGCSSLTTIIAGDKWSTDKVTQGDYMFSECTSLVGGNGTKFDENHTDPSYARVDKEGQPGYFTQGSSSGSGKAEPYAVLSEDNTTLTFYYDEQKEARGGMIVGPFDPSYGPNYEPDWYDKREYITKVVFNSSFADCTTITSTLHWFYGCSNLAEIEGISNLKTDNVTTMYCMFFGCANLASIDVSGFNTANVTNMSNMFGGCSSLATIDLSKFKTDNVTNMSGMFGSCTRLTKIDVSGFNTEKVTSMFGMFDYCSSLEVLDLSSFKTDNVTDMDLMFQNCSNLTTIYVGDNWVKDKVTVGSYTFLECSNLVGGAGTKFDASHVDYTYARIDAEGAPGYFTNIADKDKAKEEEQITATPTWAFQENMLILSCETEGAEINYAMENWTTEEEADSISKAMDVIAKSVVYSAPIEVTDNIVIKMYALKEGLRTSKDTTFIYDYKAWSELYDVIRYGVGIAEKATDNAKVDQSLVEELRWALNEGDHMYQMRAEVSSSEAEYFTVAIMEACKKIEEQLNATSGKVETPTFSFSGDSLVISTTTEDALIWYQSAAIDSTYAEGFAQYSGPIVIGDVKMNAKATKEGMEDSEVASMVYYYTEWQELIETTYQCSAILSEIEVSKPSDDILAMIQSVEVEIAYVRETYESDRLSWDRDKINEEIEKLRIATIEIEAKWKEQSANATYEGTVLTVNGQTTMDAALEQVGGRAEVAKNIAAIVWNSSASLSKSDLEGFIDNPNLLIFVKTDSIVPEGVNNVVIDGKAKSITLVDADGNNNFYAPQAFTAESISYTREFKQTTQKDVSRGWEGICLPFDVQTYTHETHGAIAPFRNDASEFHFWLHQMTDKGMTIATTIEANKPYIISMPNSSAYAATYNQAGKVTFAAKNVTIPATVFNEVWTADGKIAVLTTFAKLKADNNTYALNVNDGVDGYEEGSVFISNYRDVRPFEVYTFHEPNRASGSRFISVSSLFGGESDDSTGIIDVMENQNGEVVKVYSINGSLIKQGNRSEVMNSLPKGLYIIGNQKVMVK